MKLIEVDKLSCCRGPLCLFNNLSFALQPGQIIRLSGINGCGKTSALKTIAGILSPAKGRVLFGNAPLTPQDFTYLDHKLLLKPLLTVNENLSFWARLYNTPNDILNESYKELGLLDLQDIPVKSLSQGQSKRVQLSLLFLRKTPLWLLDEPFNSLDNRYTTRLKKMFEKHLKDSGLIIYASHIPIPGLKEQVIHLKDYMTNNDISNAA